MVYLKIIYTFICNNSSQISKNNFGKFILLVLMLNYQLALGYDFRNSSNKVQYLVHLRQNFPEIYRDFITRYDAFDFLETAQEAIDALGFKNSLIQSHSWNVFVSSENEFQKMYIVDKLKEDILKTIRAIDPKEQIGNVLLKYLSSALRYEAIIAGLSQTDASLGLKETLRSNSANLSSDLENKIGSLDIVNGVNPKLLGINKSTITGRELLELFKESTESRKLVARLFWLILLNSSNESLKSNISIAELTSKISLKTDLEIMEQLNSNFDIEKLSFLTEFKINKVTINKIFKSSKDELRKISNKTKQVENNKLLIKLERSHPYDAFTRGSVGDCSTSNCFGIPLVEKEEFFWIRKPDGSIKGYFQFTRVHVNGKTALYLNTISGAGITKEDTRAIFHTVASSLKQLGAEMIVIPTVDKIPSIINFPEAEFVFQELAREGRLTQLKYLDEESRLRLLPFSGDAVDLPEKNRQAIEVDTEKLVLSKFKIETQDLKLKSEFPFPKVSLNEIIMVALELRSRENNNYGISDLLRANNVDPVVFEKLWGIVSNQDKKTIIEFHKATKDILDSLKLEYRWDDFIQSPLFFRGHMLAPDALTGDNKELALSYIHVLIRAYSDIPLVYETLSPFYGELTKSNEFVDLVKTLFKKNLKEFDRVLDYYELEHKSAYRTLAFLCQSGLPAEKFQNEIEVLSQQWELEAKDEERKSGIFVRRVTLLGIISDFDPKYFDVLIEFLEKIALQKGKVNNDDIRTVASFISTVTTKDKLNKVQTERLEKFLTATEFGMSFLPHLGLFPIEKVNVPKLVEALFKHEKYEWAAQLIHKGTWMMRKQSPFWIKKIWQNRDKLSPELILTGFQVNPNLLKIPGIDKFIDDLMLRVSGNSQNEMALAKIILSRPEKMSLKRLEWLNNSTNPDIKERLDEYKSNTKNKQTVHLVYRGKSFLIKVTPQWMKNLWKFIVSLNLDQDRNSITINSRTVTNRKSLECLQSYSK